MRHHLVVLKAFAVPDTLFTDVCTHPTDLRVRVRLAQHEDGIGLADFGTVHQQAYVTGFGMLPTHLQTVRCCFQTVAIVGI